MDSLPRYQYREPPEEFATGDIAQGCAPEDQPGVVFFRDLILRQVGGGSYGISSCNRPQVSDHFEGRAWDWRVMADDPEDSARVDAVLEWLFENDWEVYRRLGLKYVIWNRQIYRAGEQSPYTLKNPHADHVHFSFGWPGARGETSFFRAAGFPDEPLVTPNGLTTSRPTASGAHALALLVSAAASYLVVTRMRIW